MGTSVDLATQALQRLPRGQVVCIGAKQGMGKSEDDKCRAEKSQLNPTVTEFLPAAVHKLVECKCQAGKPLVSSKGMEGKCRSDKLTFNPATKELVPSAIKASTRSLRGQRVGKGSTDEARQVCRSVGGERRSDKPTPNLMVKERVLASTPPYARQQEAKALSDAQIRSTFRAMEQSIIWGGMELPRKREPPDFEAGHSTNRRTKNRICRRLIRTMEAVKHQPGRSEEEKASELAELELLLSKYQRGPRQVTLQGEDNNPGLPMVVTTKTPPAHNQTKSSAVPWTPKAERHHPGRGKNYLKRESWIRRGIINVCTKFKSSF